MKLIKKIKLPPESIVILFTACLFSIVNSLHIIIFKFRQPSGTIFIGISHWYEDYFYYLSHLTQGAQGHWLTQNAYTTEHIRPSLIWWYNILLGKIVALTGVYPWIIYDVSIFLLVVIYIWCMHKTIASIFENNRVFRFCALIIALTSTSLFTISFRNGFHIQPITYFYSYTVALNRLGGVSHLIAQNILSLLLILQFAHTISRLQAQTSEKAYVLRSSIIVAALFVALFIISPVYVFSDGLVCFITASYYALRFRNKHTIIKLFMPLLVSLIFLLPFIFIQNQAFSDPFYGYMRQWETAIPRISFTTLLLSSGTIAVFVLLGLPFYLQNPTPLKIIGFVYSFLPFILYYSPIPTILRLPTFRFFQPPAYVFLSAMAVELAKRIPLKMRLFKSGSHRVLFFTFMFVVVQLPVIKYEVDHRIGEFYMNSSLNYVDKHLVADLMQFQTVPHTKNALATNNLELFVPVMSGLTVFSGHRTLTYDYVAKIKKVFEFYNGTMTPQEAQSFLTTNNIGYVFWNKQNGNTPIQQSYPFLRILYDSPQLRVFAPK